MPKHRCKQCKADLSDRPKRKFCSASCSATFNNKLRVKRVYKVVKCQHCKTHITGRKAAGRKYCSLDCVYSAHRKRTEQKAKAGLGGSAVWRLLGEKQNHKCKLCGQGELWNGKKLVLQRDHIDGDSSNNAMKNLRLLCPNCHTQTPTFGSKGQGSRYRKDTKRNKYLRSYKGYEN